MNPRLLAELESIAIPPIRVSHSKESVLFAPTVARRFRVNADPIIINVAGQHLIYALER